jgi:hypothetical protein
LTFSAPLRLGARRTPICSNRISRPLRLRRKGAELEIMNENQIGERVIAAGIQVHRALGGLSFDEGFKADLIVEDRVIIEIKSVVQLAPAHRKQVQTYLRLSGLKLGYLFNFGEALLRDGIVRAVNGLPDLD